MQCSSVIDHVGYRRSSWRHVHFLIHLEDAEDLPESRTGGEDSLCKQASTSGTTPAWQFQVRSDQRFQIAETVTEMKPEKNKVAKRYDMNSEKTIEAWP